ncbi:hypothetical protein B0J11DRAFT_524918 [Dendryphion nanum]|uniref:Uncharacterized protein n=1 Tax=Dendryphion nanum TaxID=256645 RepID=A0A9P9IPP3_9PLEO|nr:hypothetical protein B0J11DRAFT_524918 [Dendryphion nanum]
MCYLSSVVSRQSVRVCLCVSVCMCLFLVLVFCSPCYRLKALLRALPCLVPGVERYQALIAQMTERGGGTAQVGKWD